MNDVGGPRAAKSRRMGAILCPFSNGIEEARYAFFLDPTLATRLRWNNPSARQLKHGDVAGYLSSPGLWRVVYKYKAVSVAKVVWYMNVEEWPRQILFVDGNHLNMEISNMRDVDTAGSRPYHRKKKPIDPTVPQCPWRGVCYNRRCGGWQATAYSTTCLLYTSPSPRD